MIDTDGTPMSEERGFIGGIISRVRVLFGHYHCPDCFWEICTDECGRRHQKELSEISKIIGQEDFVRAESLINELEKKLDKRGDPEITRLRTLMVFMSGDD